MTRTKPIIIMFFHHWDDPATRERSVSAIRTVTDIYDKHGVSAHYGFVGTVLQQLTEDSPETIQKIKRMRMAIGYHGGAGHAPVGPAGHPKDTRNMNWAEAVQALWEFETHTLDVKTREPVPGCVGGYLAIQTILDIIPLPTDAKGTGRMDNPGEFVLARMGAGSYLIKAPFNQDAVILSPLHEAQLFPGSLTLGRVSTYYGKPAGVDAPLMADPLSWFDTLAKNFPENQTYVVHCMTHAGFEPGELDGLIGFLTSRPGDFLISHPDADSVQWLPENSASAFYLRTYGIRSFSELMDLKLPPTPGSIILTATEMGKAADVILSNSLLNTHDGDFAEPPEFIDLGHRRISLANVFQALALALKQWKERGTLPEKLALPFIHGPVDYPRYDRKVQPKLPDIQFIGYTPTELPIAEVPDPEVINSQGLPPAGDYHIWMPTHTLAEGMDVVTAAAGLDLSLHLPGVIHLRLQTEDSRGNEPRWLNTAVNPSEFMFAMAQVYRQLARNSKPAQVVLVNIKISANSRTECTLVKPGGPRDSFIWRSDLSPEELDVAWTRVPTPGEERILWMSLPPLGDKLKRKIGRMVGEWQLKKR